MKRIAVLILAAVFTISPWATSIEQAQGNVTVIEGATLIDGTSDTPVRDAVIVIEGQRIRAAGAKRAVDVPAEARILNMAGKTIMPGIINVHGHVGMRDGLQWGNEFYSREHVKRDANAYLYYGETHMISLGRDQEPIRGFIADQRAGRASGTRLYTAGLGFAADGWRLAANPFLNRPRTPDEARKMVRDAVAQQADFIKLLVDDSEGGPGQSPKFDPAIYGAVIDEAHQHGRRTLVHMSQLADAKELIRRGIDALAHSVRDAPVDDEFLQLARTHGVTQITTLVGHLGNMAYLKPGFLDDPGLPVLFPEILNTLRSQEYQQKARSAVTEQARQVYARAAANALKEHKAGIPIAIGTDAGGIGRFEGLSEHREMELLVEAGLAPMDVIRAATINGARFMKIDDRYGSIEAGKVADFIVLNADPLADITNTRRIDAVWMNGQQVDRSALRVVLTSPSKN